MKISINQPAFLPWINYFKRISEVDVFVILDDVQYEKNSFINRAQIKNKNNEILWLTIPLKKHKFHSEENLIKNISISSDKNWKKKQVKTIIQNFSNQKNFYLVKDCINKIYEYDDTNLSNFLTHQLKILIKILKIDTKIILSSDLNIEEKKSLKIVEICKRLNADEYISGPLGSDYLDESSFKKDNIKFSYFNNDNIHQNFENELSKYSIFQSLSFYGDRVIDYLKGH